MRLLLLLSRFWRMTKTKFKNIGNEKLGALEALQPTCNTVTGSLISILYHQHGDSDWL